MVVVVFCYYHSSLSSSLCSPLIRRCSWLCARAACTIAHVCARFAVLKCLYAPSPLKYISMCICRRPAGTQHCPSLFGTKQSTRTAPSSPGPALLIIALRIRSPAVVPLTHRPLCPRTRRGTGINVGWSSISSVLTVTAAAAAGGVEEEEEGGGEGSRFTEEEVLFALHSAQQQFHPSSSCAVVVVVVAAAGGATSCMIASLRESFILRPHSSQLQSHSMCFFLSASVLPCLLMSCSIQLPGRMNVFSPLEYEIAGLCCPLVVVVEEEETGRRGTAVSRERRAKGLECLW